MSRREKQVSVQLVGGVGNQLFQYFAGKFLSQNNNFPLRLDTSRIGIGGSNHGSSISHFDIVEKEIHSKARAIFYQSLFGRAHYYLLRRNSFYNSVVSSIFRLYQSETLGYDPELDNLKAPVTVSGYFQTAFYYQSLISSGVPRLQVKDPSFWYFKTLKLIENTESIVIHIRRGDYIPLKDTFGLLAKNYYLLGLKEMKKEFDYRDIFIFSDDLAVARKLNLHVADHTIHYITPPSDVKAVESLMLMSAAKGIILSNSTFAWWSAIMGETKHVVAPDKWFKNADSPEGLVQQHWLAIEPVWED